MLQKIAIHYQTILGSVRHYKVMMPYVQFKRSKFAKL